MTSVGSVSSKLIGGITNFKPIQKCCNYFKKEPEKAIAYSTIASVVGKDGIGCYMYVNQSLHNEKIPEDKRKFVAALDLTNGVLMIAAQLGLFFAMRKFNKPLFEKLFNKSFDKGNKVIKNIATRIRKDEKQAGQIVSRKLSINKEYNKLRKDCFSTFSFVTELVAATILAKRVIVPFIATPLAEKVKNKMNKDDDDDHKEIEKHENHKEHDDDHKEIEKSENKQAVHNDNHQEETEHKEPTNLLNKYKHD